MRDFINISNIGIDEIEGDKTKNTVMTSLKLDKLTNLALIVFGGSFVITAMIIMLSRKGNRNLFMTLPGKIIAGSLTAGILLFVLFNFLYNKLPALTWKCEHCGQKLPYVWRLGNKSKLGNKNIFEEIDDKNIRVGRVKGSGIIVPEVCPHCGERLLKKRNN